MIYRWIERLLLLWLTLLSLAAYFWPRDSLSLDPFAATIPHVARLFSVIMFTIGCLMSREEIREVLRNWPTVLSGTAVQYTVMPLAAYFLGHAFGLREDLLLGVILVGCVPGAMASNVLTLTARGNVSYSVSLTTSATLLSPLVVPLALYLAVGQTGIDRQALMKQSAFELITLVVGPVLAGHFLSRWLVPLATFMRHHGPTIANLAILWLIATIVSNNREKIAPADGSLSLGDVSVLLACLALINVAGYCGGYAGGLALRLPEAKRRALSIEVGMQNAGLGTVLARQLFPDSPEVGLPPVFYMFGCMLSGIVLAQIWSMKPAPSDAPQPQA